MNVSEQLLKILKSEGVNQVFGVAGDALNFFVNAIEQDDSVEWVRVNHEGNGSYAAFAQAELSGELGVCASTVGPGALHLVNGLYNAKKERSPVLAITGQIPVEHIGTNYHQEVDLKKVFDDICEYQAIIRSPEEAPRVILRAIRIALNKKAVCRIELPSDVAEMKAENQSFVKRVFISDSLILPSEESFAKAAQLINSAEKVSILAGIGCRGAKETIVALSKKLKAPITHSLKASDIFDLDTENVVGQTGLIGNSSGYKGVMESDLLIMMGTDFPYTEFLPPDTKTIQVDIRPENIGNRTNVEVGLHGDVSSVASGLLEISDEKKDSSFLESCLEGYKKWRESSNDKASIDRSEQTLHPQVVAKAVSDWAENDAIFVIDTGTSAIWSSNFMNFHSGRRMIGSFNHGSMAVGLPAAIGAKLKYPEREVWAMVGDGAFNMSLHEFSTAVEYDLPINIIVFNNSELGFVKIEMEEAGLKPSLNALQQNNIEFTEYAKLCGGDGVTVSKASELEKAIKKCRLSKKPFLINAIVNSGELSLPPKIGYEEVKGFGTSKVKEIISALKGDKKQLKNLIGELNSFLD